MDGQTIRQTKPSAIVLSNVFIVSASIGLSLILLHEISIS